MISTSRLLLRPFSLADIPKLVVMSGEEGIRRWIPDQVYRDPQHAEQVIRALMAHTERDPEPRARPYVLGIEHAEAGVLIGHVGLSPARGSVEIGYAVEQQQQRKGLAIEAVTAMSRWAVAELGLPEVLGIVAADNVPSCRVLESSGFVRSAEEIQRGSTTLVIYRFVRTAPANF